MVIINVVSMNLGNQKKCYHVKAYVLIYKCVNLIPTFVVMLMGTSVVSNVIYLLIGQTGCHALVAEVS